MNITTLLIVVAVIIPGYLIVNRISRVLYSDDSKWDKKIENQYGFNRFDKQTDEKEEQKEDENINEAKSREDENNITSEGIKKET